MIIQRLFFLAAFSSIPAFALDVEGPIRSTSGTIDVRIQAGAAGAAGIGSFSNDPLLFFSNSAERMRINTDGNVGIGTNSPAERLHVAGNFLLNGNLAIRGGGYLAVQFYNFDAPPDQKFSEISEQNGQITFRTVNDAYSAASHWLEVRRTAGSYGIQSVSFPSNVGIGTINPAAKLTIVGGPADPLQLKDAFGHSFRMGPGVGIAGGFQFYDDVAAAVRLRIDDSGNIGIGETNPTHKLAVNGTIKAKEVIVETSGWSDYVFDDNYRLAPLSEVEAHIKTNKHLPGIPSAAKIATEGISVGELQAKLLAKIEELTLHQIAQEKELVSLRQEVRTLREASAK